MKSLTKTIAVTAVLITTAATIFVSCKKDNDETFTQNRQTEVKSEAQVVYEKVKRFESLRKSYHSNSRSDNGTVPVSEARLILDASINYEYSDVNRYLEDRDLDTLYYTAPFVNSQGEVALNDLIDIYDRFSSDIEKMENTVNLFMVTFSDANTRSNNIEIVYTRGTPTPTPTPVPTPNVPNYPFGDDEDWIWGMDNGRCDIGGYSDAAQELTKKFANTTRRGQIGVADTAQIKPMIWDMEYDDVGATEKLNDEDCSTYWLFYVENVPIEDISSYCIDNFELNCYYRSICRYVVSETGCFHYSPNLNSPYREVEIKWHEEKLNDEYSNLQHYAYIYYYKIGFAQLFN